MDPQIYGWLSEFLRSLAPRKDCDFVDQLNYVSTSVILLVFTVFVTIWSYATVPISCWFPAYYRFYWIQYATDYCYVQNTYFIPLVKKGPTKNYFQLIEDTVPIPQNVTEREDKVIGYYQWVPIVLGLQCLCFLLPIQLWRSFYTNTGEGLDICAFIFADLNVEHVVELSNLALKPGTPQKAHLIDRLNIYLSTIVDLRQQLGIHQRKTSLMYLFIKLLFLANCTLQFVLLTYFVGFDNFFWGFIILFNMVKGVTWQESTHFPRVTLCDFEIRSLGNVHRNSVQCVLKINMFNEKMFVFLWWWFIIVGALNLVWWTFALTPCATRSFVRRFAPQQGETRIYGQHEQQLNEFVDVQCRSPDHMFVLRLVHANCGPGLCHQLVHNLWHKHRGQSVYINANTSKNGYPIKGAYV